MIHTPMDFVILILYAVTLYLLGVHMYLRYRLRRVRAIYRFCDIRRTVMQLVKQEKLSVHSPTFHFLYRGTSRLIHYSDLYRFTSREFLSAIRRDEHSLENEKVYKLIRQDAEKQGEEVHRVISALGEALFLAFKENSMILRIAFATWWISAPLHKLYRLIKTIGPFSQITESYHLMSSAKKWKESFA